jgi:hypothetical protein
MHIVKQTKVDPFYFFRWGFFLCSALSIGLGMIAGIYLFFGRGPINLASVKKAVVHNPSFPYEKIGSGCLSLNFHHSERFAPDLSHELFFLAKNKRPDAEQSNSSFILSLKKAKQHLEVLNGQTVYLAHESEKPESMILFSTRPTSFWIKPVLSEQGGVIVEVFKEVVGGESSLAKIEKTQFTLLENAPEFKRMVSSSEPFFIASLRFAKVWGQDLLIKHYGGGTYQALKEKTKLEFSEKNSSYLCFVEQGDYLSWENEKWQVKKLKDISPGFPLARIQSIQAKEVHIESWDDRGFQMFFLSLEKQMPSKWNPKFENVISGVRLRTSSQMSCLMEKRRVLLKEGDWVLKTSMGWHILKKSQEILDFLEHRMTGELFVFDKLDKEEGKLTIKGHLFDPTRTQVQRIELPIKTDSKTKTVKKRKTSYLGNKK